MFQNKYLNFYSSLPKNLKRGLYFIIILFLLSSFFEVFTILSINPLTSILFEISNIEKIPNKIYIDILFLTFQFKLSQLILISISLSTLTIILRLQSLKNSTKLAQLIGAYLANRALTSILINTEGESNLENQGSDLITSITSEQIGYAVMSINAQLQLVNNFFNTLILSIGIIYISPRIALSLILI